MPIALECPACRTPFQVDDSCAGRTGTCKHCGGKVTVPGHVSSSTFSTRVSLAEATPAQFIVELARRQISAVLAYSEPAADNPAQSPTRPRRTLHVLKTGDLTEENVCNLFVQLADQGKQELAKRLTQATGDASGLYELKGDRLGMDLGDFKAKHHRVLPGLGKTMPWCSDESPGRSIPELGADDWHAAAGIVSCRLDLPAENNSPKLAGVATSSVIYQFLDGKLFNIEAVFSTQDFTTLLESLRKKYGEPTSETQNPRRITWRNPVAFVELTFGAMRPPKPSRLRYCYEKLCMEALARRPDKSADI